MSLKIRVYFCRSIFTYSPGITVEMSLHTEPSYPPAAAKPRAILLDNERRTAGSATSSSAHTLQYLHTETGIGYRSASPSAFHRPRESFAAKYRAGLETLLRYASALFVHSASHRPGNRNLLVARTVPRGAAIAGCGRGGMCDDPGAGSSSRPGTSVHSIPRCHMAQLCGVLPRLDARDSLWQSAAAVQ